MTGPRLRIVGVDPDPAPRASAVQASSAYAAVAAARPVVPESLTIAPVATLAARRLVPLRSWDFLARPGEAAAPVVLPDTWSRRDPGLAEHRGPCEYTRRVTADGPHSRLVFDAIDYVGEVYLDGERVAVHEGGFTPVAVALPVGHPVEVRVVVHDPAEKALDGLTPLLAPKRKIKGVHEWHDSRPGGLAVGELFRPRWAERWGSGGLGGAAVHTTGQLRLDAVFVTPTRDQLAISWVVTNLGTAAQPAELTAAVGDDAVVATAVLPTGPSRISVITAVDGARPWAPDDPVVLPVATSVADAAGISDSLTVTTGLRDVQMDVSGPRQFQLHVNGHPTYIRAANYIGGIWPFELDHSLVATDVDLAKAAHLNSLGVHAGVCPPLYNLTDRAGLLVFQDFPLQWSYDPAGAPLVAGGPDFRTASGQLAAELVYSLYNHPSIVYWCGHNEPAYQLAEAFSQAEVPELAALASSLVGCPDETAADDERASILRWVDPGRPVVSASGLGATRPDGDVHVYAGSLSGGHALDGAFGRAAFVSEYGAWSANFSAATRAVAAVGDWPPPASCELEWHEQTHLVGVQNAYAGNPSRFEEFSSWCFAGQLWAGWHAKVCTEQIRLARFAPSGGHRWHFFIDHWGDGGAGLVDRLRATGPAYNAFAAANRPVLPVIPLPAGGRVDPGTPLQLPISVVNDTCSSVRGPLTWSVEALAPDDAYLVGRDEPDRRGTLQAEVAPTDHVCVLPRRRGRQLAAGTLDVDVPGGTCTRVAEIGWLADVRGPVAVVVEVAGQTNWSAFVVEPPEWRPVPGLAGRHRFRVTSDRPGTLRRRWTGEVVDPSSAPPDHYLLGDLPVDVYDDVHVGVDGSVNRSALPWPDGVTPALPSSGQKAPKRL